MYMYIITNHNNYVVYCIIKPNTLINHLFYFKIASWQDHQETHCTYCLPCHALSHHTTLLPLLYPLLHPPIFPHFRQLLLFPTYPLHLNPLSHSSILLIVLLHFFPFQHNYTHPTIHWLHSSICSHHFFIEVRCLPYHPLLQHITPFVAYTPTNPPLSLLIYVSPLTHFHTPTDSDHPLDPACSTAQAFI